jgi:hypothetical protein
MDRSPLFSPRQSVKKSPGDATLELLQGSPGRALDVQHASPLLALRAPRLGRVRLIGRRQLVWVRDIV